MPRVGKFFLILLILTGVGYFLYGRFFAPQGGWGGMEGGAPPVGVAEVIEREVQPWYEFSGRLVAVDSAEIRPRVSGTIEKVHFQEGQIVKKGDPLFTIDQRPYRAALQSAEARATWADSELARAKSLLADKAIPQRDFDQRKNAADVAKADLIRARLDMDYSIINAPIDGRVSRAEITTGNLVDSGGNAPVLTRIVSDKPIYADFDIDEKIYLQYLRTVGSDMEKLKTISVYLGLSGEDGAPHEGRVQSFDNQLDTRSGTLRVRAVFANEDGKLIPGLFARLKLAGAEKAKTILITDRAVGTDQNKKFALVVGADGKVQYREIKLGASADGLRIVESGLAAGDKIVVDGLQRARPGMPVSPEVVPMEPVDGKRMTEDEKKETKNE